MFHRIFLRALFSLFVIGFAAKPAVCQLVYRVEDLPKIAEAAAAGDWDDVAAATGHQDVNVPLKDGMTALHFAAQHQRPLTVVRLLQAGADPNAKTDYDITPLAIACTLNNHDVVQSLLDADADANHLLPGKTTLLMLASRAGNAQIVQQLLEEDSSNINAQERSGQTALMWAAAEGNLEATQTLLRAGADAGKQSNSGFTALLFAAREGQIDVANCLLDHGSDLHFAMKPEGKGKRVPRKGMSALLLAVESGHFELAMELVSRGADPNDLRSGFSPLHILASVRKPKRGEEPDGDPPRRGSGNLTALQFVRAIVAEGADVNLRMKGGQKGKATLGHKGATPMLLAGKTCDLPYLQLLLELGGDPTLTNADGCTGLMAAAGVGVRAVGEEPGTIAEVCETIDFFLAQAVDINTVDNNGETAMHGAAYRNFPEVVAHLAERGANPMVWDQKNKWGWTPVMIAQGKRPGSFKPSPETVEALHQAGAERR